MKWKIEFDPVLSTFLSVGVLESCISFTAVFPSVTCSQSSSVPRREVINFDLALQMVQFIYTYSALYFINTDFESNEVCLVHLEIHFGECV